MSTWPTLTLNEIAAADDLHIAPYRGDGTTAGTPTWIWSVVVDGHLYVRPYNGQRSRWYQAARSQHAGQITTGGQTHRVHFAPAEAALNPVIDAAYRTKYADSAYLAPMLAAGPRSTTIEIQPDI